jgi:hypothetical protein
VRDAENLGAFDRGAAKQREAFGVIGVVAGGGPVETLPVKVRRVIHEINPDTGDIAGGHDGAETILVVEGHGDAAHDSLRFGEFGLAIARQVDADLVA